ncbi:MAG: sulfatase [Candidatus Altiarchaeota archaeon]
MEWRRYSLFIAGILLISGCVREEVKIEKPGCTNCNVILVTFDALRADHLGAYGYDKPTSPTIDALAKKSFIFTNSFSQCGSTSCSIPSIHTSKFPQTDNILSDGLTPKEEETTLAEILKKNGYNTYAVVAVNLAKSEYGSSQGFDVFDDRYDDPEIGNETRERVINMLGEIRENLEKDGKPVFLWIHFREPHSPYNPDMKTFKEFYHNPGNEPLVYGIDGPKAVKEEGLDERFTPILDYYVREKKESPSDYLIFGKRLPLTPTMYRQYQAMYDGNIKKIDNEFRIVLDQIKESGLDEDTMIIVGNDHGESLGEHNIFDHNKLYYGVVHSPLIVHLPSDRHETIDYPVMSVDILPTILELVGIQEKPDIRGQNLFNPREEDYIQFAEYKDIKTIKRGDYKLLIDTSVMMGTLYNIREDPGETKPVTKENLDTAKKLIKDLEDIKKSGIQSTEDQVDTLERLREIGYAY